MQLATMDTPRNLMISGVVHMFQTSKEYRASGYYFEALLQVCLVASSTHGPRVTLVVDLEVTASAGVVQVRQKTAHKVGESVLALGTAGQGRALFTPSAELQLDRRAEHLSLGN